MPEQLLDLADRRDRAGPADVERELCDHLDEFILGDPILDGAREMKTQLLGLAGRDERAQVMRLRSRFESCGRSQTSPNNTSSVSCASFGAMSPMVFWAVLLMGVLLSTCRDDAVRTSDLDVRLHAVAN